MNLIAHSLYEKMFSGMIEANVKPELEKEICKRTISLVNNKGNEKLRKLPLQVL